MSAELLLAVLGILAAPLTAWLSSKLTRRKYDTEIARLRADVAAAWADANRKELENARLGNEIIMQNIVHPLEAQIKRLNTNVTRLEKAVGKISNCPHAADCPVSHELLAIEKNDGGKSANGKHDRPANGNGAGSDNR